MKSGIARVAVALAMVTAAAPAGAITGVWSTDFHTTGPNDDVECLLRWDGAVYAAGDFTAIGPTSMTCGVAREQDGAWLPVGDAIEALGIIDLCVHDEALHALAVINGGRQVWRLDGESWTPAGPMLADNEVVLGSYAGDLYLGRHRLEDGAWVDRLQTDGRVRALAVHDGLLVAGGEFTSAGGLATGHVCGWDGAAVVDAFPGQDVEVRNLVSWNGELHASRYSGGAPLVGVQVWRDGAWTDIPELGNVNYTDVISDLAVGDGRLLVCNYTFPIIVKAEGSRSSSVRAWDGAAVSPIYAPGEHRRLLAVAEGDDGVWVGGSFTVQEGDLPANLGLVRGGVLEPVCEPGLGASGVVSLLKVGHDGLAVGGSFSNVGGVSSRGVALRDQGGWESWGLENWAPDPYWYSSPQALGWNGFDLYTYATGHAGDGVGRFRFGAWDFGDWIYQQPGDLVGWNGQVYGPSGYTIYRYSVDADPAPWSSADGTISAAIVDGGDLIVGGDFASIEGVAAARVAINDGSGWAPMGSGLGARVVVLGRYGGDPVAVTVGPGGEIDVNVIHIWNGSSWQQLGVLTGGPVRCLAEYSGCLFAGGYIEMDDASGVPMRGLACWNGFGWESVGDAPITRALAVYDGKLWVGGHFDHAGGTPATHLSYFSAELTDAPDETPAATSVALAAPMPNPFNPQTVLRFDLPRPLHARLEIFDAAGRRVATVLDEPRDAGRHAVRWTGTDDAGRALPSGTYLVRLRAGEITATTKAQLVR